MLNCGRGKHAQLPHSPLALMPAQGYAWSGSGQGIIWVDAALNKHALVHSSFTWLQSRAMLGVAAARASFGWTCRRTAARRGTMRSCTRRRRSAVSGLCVLHL